MSIQPRISNAELHSAMISLSSKLRVSKRLAARAYRKGKQYDSITYRRMWSKFMRKCRLYKSALRVVTNLLHRRLFLCSATATPVPQKYQSLDYTVSDVIYALRLSKS